LEVNLRDRVVVETDTGLETGWVVVAPDQVVYSEVKGPLRLVLRVASQEEQEDGGGAREAPG
jgi:cell fate regulator YaaT (PSP1 superfamily)